MADEVQIALTTVDREDTAQALAQGLVAQRLAACVQIEAIQSVYRWDGAVQSEREWRLLIKTTAPQAPAVQRFLSEHHPYQLPAWVTWPAVASPAFAQWVQAEVGV